MELNDGAEDRTIDVADPNVQQVVRTWLTAEEVIEKLERAGRHTTAAAIHQRRRRGRLLGARVDGRWRYAPFQFEQGQVRDDVETLLRLVTCRWPADIASWFVLSSEELGGQSPQDLLLSGGLTRGLREVAREFGRSDWVTRDLP
ncbi:MAG: hypothetical protein J7518_09965 [Nocardioidaceae bacterium]|nr:hypothetical protein [Nocardioidaceae bacterium]